MAIVGYQQLINTERYSNSWDYNIRELALYDLPAVVEHVKKESECQLEPLKDEC